MSRQYPHPSWMPSHPPPPGPIAPNPRMNMRQPGEVDYTISEDHSAGHAAHAESGLRMLAADPVGAFPPGFSGGVGSNESLQDYQMQLMLLEQQNKKRLMMAREEQDRTLPLRPPVVNPPEIVNLEPGQSGQDSDEGSRPQQPAPEEPSPVVEETSAAPNDTGLGPRHVVLYRVVCPALNGKCHGFVYEHEPHNILRGGERHLGNGQPVLELDAFLAGWGPKPFVVYREVHCNSIDTRLQGHSTGPSGDQPDRNIVSIVSRELHAAVQRISLFAPDFGAGHTNHGFRQHPRSPSALLSQSPSEYAPYFFYHHREHIAQAATTESSGQEMKDLWAYLQEHSDPMSSKCDDLFSRGLVSSETLPWLFRPNEVIVAQEGQYEIAYVLRTVPRGGDSESVELECWNWGYNGVSLHRKDKVLSLTVPAYGTVPISELSIYPLRFASAQTKERLHARGQRFWELRNQTHVSYEGPDYNGERVYPWDSRCMIDYQIYHKFHGHADAFRFSNHRIVTFDTWRTEIPNTATLSPVETMLLPPGIHGFFLKDKKWVHLRVDNIAPVSWNKEAFDRLVLPPRIKNLAKALVLVRKTNASTPPVDQGPKGKRSDLIRGKGGGLIMLLHGGPGTGKTLTAESVAELAEMPLYNVTCGDVGTKPEAVEKYLNSVLHLGQKWNCVLLLDEADVFLEQRSLSDLKRNSLVSVFLRTLEYYDGILILTSNRVGTFDAAFKSRIQVALHYPPLDLASRRTVWQNFFGMLRADAEDVDFDGVEAHLDELAAQEMNGRQIRNAVTTARQLALFEGARLAWEHVDAAIAAASDFDRHVGKRRGMTEEEWVMDGVSEVTGVRFRGPVGEE